MANLYMEYFEQKSLNNVTHPPRLWFRYVDDIFVIQKEENEQNIPEHINSVDPTIMFTVEDTRQDGTIPFLDTLVKPEADNTLFITVYMKPTHTDQCLQWDSHHHMLPKYSVINTLTHRDRTLCSKLELVHKEMNHLRKALSNCKYPRWIIDKVERRVTQLTSEGNNSANNQDITDIRPTTETKTRVHCCTLYPEAM